MLQSFEITDDHKDAFIELIYAGHRANTAAKEVGTTGSKMRAFRNPKSVHYDEFFAHEWDEAERSEEHRKNREDHLRALVDERSETSDNILVKRMMAELPEYEHLRHTNFRGEITVTLAQKLLPGLTDEELDKVIAAGEKERALERGEIKLLPPVEEETG